MSKFYLKLQLSVRKLCGKWIIEIESLKHYFSKNSEFSRFLSIRRLFFFSKMCFFLPALFICFLILITLFLMHMKHCCSRLHIWACLLLHQPLLSGLLPHKTISAENDTQCITLQILGFFSLILCAFFLSTNIPASNHKYWNTKYQPWLYGNPYRKRHKCGII